MGNKLDRATGALARLAERQHGVAATKDPFGPPLTIANTDVGANTYSSVAVHGDYVYYSPYGGPIGRVRADGSALPTPAFIPLREFAESIGIAVDGQGS